MLITLDNVFDLLDEAVASKPAGYRYFDDHSIEYVCAYREPHEDATPACIIGWVLHRAGFDLGTLDDNFNTYSITELLERVPEVAALIEDEQVRMLLRLVQMHQDANQSWAEAVNLGKNADLATLMAAYDYA